MGYIVPPAPTAFFGKCAECCQYALVTAGKGKKFFCSVCNVNVDDEAMDMIFEKAGVPGPLRDFHPHGWLTEIGRKIKLCR
jgi:hypothetical protein